MTTKCACVVVLPQADHPEFLLNSEQLISRTQQRNADEHYNGYNFLQNTELNQNVSTKFMKANANVLSC